MIAANLFPSAPKGWSISPSRRRDWLTVIVRPTTPGADVTRRDAYAKAAIAARNNWFHWQIDPGKSG
jgi:hypothetical protein